MTILGNKREKFSLQATDKYPLNQAMRFSYSASLMSGQGKSLTSPNKWSFCSPDSCNKQKDIKNSSKLNMQFQDMTKVH
jgi:hypothetical protein